MFNIVYLKYGNVPCKSITEQKISSFMNDRGTKRFNLSYTQQDAIRIVDRDNEKAWLNAPFTEPMNSLLSSLSGYSPFLYERKNGKGAARCLKTEEEYVSFIKFIDPYKDLVFLRDCLDLSISLSMHESEPGVRTELGEAEYQVKYNQDDDKNMDMLVRSMQHWLEVLPYFKLADYVCCIPSSRPFMHTIVSRLNGFQFEDISNDVLWKNKNDEIKGKTTEEKINLLNQFDLQINHSVEGKTILLLDDMYQSGLTMQYVAMRMKQAGAKYVFGMTLVKALTNA